jgi:hypothetical protein
MYCCKALPSIKPEVIFPCISPNIDHIEKVSSKVVDLNGV